MTNEKLELLTENLTQKMRGFAERYVIHLNATKAAEECGCTGKHLQEIGSSMLHHPRVAAYIQYLRQQQMDRMGASKDRVLLELCRIAFVDIRDLYDEQGCIKSPKDMPDDVAAAIAGISTKEIFEQDGRRKKYVGDAKTVKLTEKTKALEMLAKHLGLFQLDNMQKQDVTIVVSGNESKDIWDELQNEY